MDYPQQHIKPYDEEGKKTEQVERMFDNIAHAYDKLNHTLSMGIDRSWRKKAIDTLRPFSPRRIMDVATGTGDFAILACRELQPDESFDAVTVAFGIRNFDGLDKGLSEMCRVLVPGGHLVILELSTPDRFPMKQLFTVYSKAVIPLLGKFISKDNSAYTYLPQTIGYFNEKFKAENIDAEYVNFEIPRIEDFMEVIEENPNLCGLNVTIPYKEQVIPYLDELDKDTAKIGAVNVIKIVRLPKGKIKLIGCNSDIIGFTQSIEPLLQPQHKKALILGTGGASKAVYRGLENLGIESTFVSRTKKDDKFLTYGELTPEIMAGHTVIVNCTPVGMFPKVDFCPDIPYELLTPNHLLYDLLYNPNETLFMKKGKAQGAVTKNGLEMLLLQAFAAWEIWNK